MIFSCIPVNLFVRINSGQMTVPEWAAFGKQIGLDRIDLSTQFLGLRTEKALCQLRNSVEAQGIGVGMLATYSDMTMPGGVAWEQGLAHALSDIAAGAQLGASYIRIAAGQNRPEVAPETALGFAVEGLKRCAEAADRWNIRLVVENHSKPGAWAYEDILFNTERFEQLVYDLRDTSVGVNFDTANTTALGDDAVALFKRVYQRVVTIHVNDLEAPGTLKFTAVGKGCAPIREIAEIAKKNGFDGLVSTEASGEPTPECLKLSVDNTRSIWL